MVVTIIHALGKHQPNRDLATPILLLREIKRGVKAAVFCDGDEVVVSDKALPNNRSRRFGFDRVFGEIVQIVR